MLNFILSSWKLLCIFILIFPGAFLWPDRFIEVTHRPFRPSRDLSRYKKRSLFLDKGKDSFVHPNLSFFRPYRHPTFPFYRSSCLIKFMCFIKAFEGSIFMFYRILAHFHGSDFMRNLCKMWTIDRILYGGSNWHLVFVF